MNNSSIKFASIAFLILGSSSSAFAFDIEGNKWLGGETDFYVALNGTSGTGISWNTAFVDALEEWNQETDFNFVLRNEHRNPCADDALNGVDFTEDVCGTQYGSNTLAVTLIRFAFELLGPPRIVEADIVVNQLENYNIYDGNLGQIGIPSQDIDFRRVALHELGHALGLNHEAPGGEPAIMAPSISNLDRLQADDIAGTNALYGGLSNCEITSLQFGSAADALNSGDCTVAELTVGGSDTSFIDLYEFTVDTPTSFQFEMSGPNLDSVLALADQDLRFIAVDDKNNDICASSLNETLPAGSYFLLANTYDIPAKTECGNTGSYVLNSYFSTTSLPQFDNTSSFSGASSAAKFSGGISADNGLSFGNRFSPNDSLDVSAQIEIDPAHRGKSGFIIVAALVNDQVLLKNNVGEFVEHFTGLEGLVRASTKVLQSVEDIDIVSDLVTASLGIQDITVDFVVGYGLTSEPDEVYYHETPINLTIAP